MEAFPRSAFGTWRANLAVLVLAALAAGCAAPGFAPLSASASAAAAPATASAAASLPVADAATRDALAPTGVLRIAVYPGSPTSLVRAKDGSPAGVGHDLGHALGRALGVPVRVVELQRAAQLTEALQAGQADFTFTNASEARAKVVDFTEPVVRLELGYLVPAGSRLAAIAEVDAPGVRIGLSQGSTTFATLSRQVKAATLVPVASMAEAAARMKGGQLDAYATNKGILNELADAVPGARLLPGRWGVEHIAIAVPKGREAGAPFLRRFVQSVRADGSLQRIVDRAGLRGAAND